MDWLKNDQFYSGLNRDVYLRPSILTPANNYMNSLNLDNLYRNDPIQRQRTRTRTTKRTVMYTMTKTVTENEMTTKTNTIAISGCTPSPLPYDLCVWLLKFLCLCLLFSQPIGIQHIDRPWYHQSLRQIQIFPKFYRKTTKLKMIIIWAILNDFILKKKIYIYNIELASLCPLSHYWSFWLVKQLCCCRKPSHRINKINKNSARVQQSDDLIGIAVKCAYL